MWPKIKKMLGSVRFWFCIIFAVAFYLGKADLLMAEIAKSIEIFTALGVAIRTFDGTVDKFTNY